MLSYPENDQVQSDQKNNHTRFISPQSPMESCVTAKEKEEQSNKRLDRDHVNNRRVAFLLYYVQSLNRKPEQIRKLGKEVGGSAMIGFRSRRCNIKVCFNYRSVEYSKNKVTKKSKGQKQRKNDQIMCNTQERSSDHPKLLGKPNRSLNGVPPGNITSVYGKWRLYYTIETTAISDTSDGGPHPLMGLILLDSMKRLKQKCGERCRRMISTYRSRDL